MKRILYYLIQWTWGLPQNLVGAALYAAFARAEHWRVHGAVATRWRGMPGSAGVGMFIFLADDDPALLAHEYGHTLQSALLGPLFSPVIALPSLIWALLPALARYRKRRGVSYYAFYPERWASRWGKRWLDRRGG